MKRDLSVDAKISVPERLSYTCGNIGNCIGLAIISMYMMYYYKDILHINAGMIATIMLISRVFDGVTDIFMGCVVDRTHSKKGKARVWLLRGAVPYILSVIGIFFVPSAASDMVKYIYIFVMYNLANAFYAYSAMLVSRAAEVLGKDDDHRKYLELHDRIVRLFQDEYITKNGRLVSETQTGLVLALQFDLIKEEHRKKIASSLEENIKRHNGHLTTGFVGTPHKRNRQR